MVFVLDKNKKPLDPCHEARARKLLSKKKASVYRRFPFTIILHRAVDGEVKPCQLKIDPGSRHTGLAIERGKDVFWMGQIEHKTTIKKDLSKRANYRRHRRNKNLRYRKVRFNNRKKPKGWFPPTIISRLQNVETMALRLMKPCPIGEIKYELVHFDTQLLMNPDIKGKEYQEGPLYRTEMRTYLLDTYKGVCQYCRSKSNNAKMEWEHVVPKSRGGSNSLTNATLSCHACNEEKGDRTPQGWAIAIKGKKRLSALDNARLKGIEKVENRGYSRSLAAAGITNTIRWKLKEQLEAATKLPVSVSTARWTKYNRVQQNLPKEHCIDAACVGKDAPQDLHFRTQDCLVITASGHGKHCRTNVNKKGFPTGYLPNQKKFFGFQTGDMAVANVSRSNRKPLKKVADDKKKKPDKHGRHVGKVSCRST